MEALVTLGLEACCCEQATEEDARAWDRRRDTHKEEKASDAGYMKSRKLTQRAGEPAQEAS